MNTCATAFDGVCDDGRPGAVNDHCDAFTDCGDCCLPSMAEDDLDARFILINFS